MRAQLPTPGHPVYTLSAPPGAGTGRDTPGLPALPGVARGASNAGGVSDLRRYLHVLQRRWRLVVVVAATVVAAVAAGTLAQTPVYRASGLMELRGQSGEGVPVEALFQAVRLSNQFLGTQYGVMRSPALARRVMNAVGMLPATARDGGAAGGAGGRRVASADSSAAVKRKLDDFGRRLIVDPVTGSNLVWIHFEASDPQLATRVVNAVFESYASMRTEVGRTVVERLRLEVDSSRQRLTVAERQLQAYARQNGLALVGGTGGTPEDLPRERLRLLQQQLAEAEADRYSKESLYNLARARRDDMLESEILQALNVRLATLRSEYAKLRSTFMEDYPRTREAKGQVDEVQALLASERGRLRGAITSRYLAAVRREELLQRAVDAQRALVDRQGETNTQYRILARDVEAQQALHAKLQEKLRTAEVSAAVASADVSVLEPASVPTRPVRPDVASNLQLGLIAGVMLGVMVAFLREHADVTIRSADELESLPVPLLGIIPAVPLPREQRAARWTHQLGARPRVLVRGVPARGLEASSGPRTVRIDGPDTPSFPRGTLADAFGNLRTAVLFAQGARAPARSLLVTSAQPGEGKTTIAVNLALSLARLGGRVLLIDADLRRPTAHQAFGVPNNRGLSEFLRDDAALREFPSYFEEGWRSLVREVATGLDLLPAGPPLRSPTELLASARTTTLLEQARDGYDFVVLDAPALLINAADTRILAQLVDGVVMVVRSGTTPRPIVGALVQQVPNVVGMVLNDVALREFASYYHSYEEQKEELEEAVPT